MRNVLLSLLLFSCLLSSTTTWALTPQQAQKNFCEVKSFFVKNKAFVTTFDAISYSSTLFGGTLAVLIQIESQRKALEKGLDASRLTLKTISFAGPLKAFGRAVIPFMDNSAKIIKANKLDSNVAKLYTKVYTPISYTMLGLKTALHSIQVAAVATCDKGTFYGQSVTRKGLEKKKDAFLALSRRSVSKIKQIVRRCGALHTALKPYKGPFTSMGRVVRPLKRPLQLIQKGLSGFNKAMKPVFLASKLLVKEMNKRRCITYGVKVKVKVKVKKKVWKTKVKTKVKKVQFCFQFSKIVGKMQHLQVSAQKPVNDLFNKAIKPIMKKITKGIQKGLKLTQLKRVQNKMKAFQSKLNTFKSKLQSKASGIKSDVSALQSIRTSLNNL